MKLSKLIREKQNRDVLIAAGAILAVAIVGIALAEAFPDTRPQECRSDGGHWECMSGSTTSFDQEGHPVFGTTEVCGCRMPFPNERDH